MENNLTYMDCWHFIAPLIPVTTDFAQDVYVMTFHALQEAEERRIAEKRKEKPKDEKINDYLTTPDLLCQLAEEASELAQAALKLKRAMDGTNPTPKSVEECVANMDEEIADVAFLVDLIGYNEPEHMLAQSCVVQRKKERWLKRLQEAHNDP